MKKDYMKPEGKVVTLRMNENISTSGDSGVAGDTFGMSYIVAGDKTYIYTSSFEASNTGDDKYDRFYDLIISYIHGLSNCRYDPD